jgi:Transglutaminase-like superfamily
MEQLERRHQRTCGAHSLPLLHSLVLLLLIMASQLPSSIAGRTVSETAEPMCRSDRHIIQWITTSTTTRPEIQENVMPQRRMQQLDSEQYITCHSKSLEDAKQEAWEFLREHVMEFDKDMLNTLGFGDRNGTKKGPDGLDRGLIGTTIDLAFQAKQKNPWTDALPQDIFYEYVLNYANLNEARSNWRQLLWDILDPMLQAEAPDNVRSRLTPNDVVRLVNEKLWSAFPGDKTIHFVSGQTPLIFDPMSVIAFRYASCTGLAIFFVNALRTVGIAARVVGTPAWNGDRDKGNHNWVEIYDPTTMASSAVNNQDHWRFLEPSANQTKVDDLNTQACSKWFCEPGRFPPKSGGANTTKVYAARLVFSTRESYCPMAWEWDCHDVPGEDRSEFYQRVCSQC